MVPDLIALCQLLGGFNKLTQTRCLEGCVHKDVVSIGQLSSITMIRNPQTCILGHGACKCWMFVFNLPAHTVWRKRQPLSKRARVQLLEIWNGYEFSGWWLCTWWGKLRWPLVPETFQSWRSLVTPTKCQTKISWAEQECVSYQRIVRKKEFIIFSFWRCRRRGSEYAPPPPKHATSA